MNHATVNKHLESAYRDTWDDLMCIKQIQSNLYGPHLISVSDEYTNSDVRVMIVGQQAKEWGKGTSNDRTSFLDLYQSFMQQPYQSPFWHASEKVYLALNPNTVKRGFVWSNLYKFDEDNKRPKKSIEDKLIALNLLQKEIKILRPHVIVFFIGPNYQKQLAKFFPGLKQQKISLCNPWSKVSHQSLPHCSYVAYHPGYLWRKRLFDSTTDQMVCDSMTKLGL